MSFIEEKQGRSFEPGWFLANNEQCTRETREMTQDMATTTSEGVKYVPMGSVYPSDRKSTRLNFQQPQNLHSVQRLRSRMYQP